MVLKLMIQSSNTFGNLHFHFSHRLSDGLYSHHHKYNILGWKYPFLILNS
uniref:Uncharacterized protein n=1 Tax=Anguilla anguilla TaxID=7936 RepID=A0A0E9X0M7_ANGAN